VSSSPPTVEAIIVSFNTRELLGDCLRPIEAHRPAGDVAELRVTVVDNGSTDGSAAMVLEAFPHVSLIDAGGNLGFAGANNLAIARSTSEYVLLLNSDTVLVGDLVRPLLRVLEDDERIAIVGPRLVYPDGEIQASSETFPTLSFELARVLRQSKLSVLLRSVIDMEALLSSARAPSFGPADGPRPAEFLWATCWLMRRHEAAALGLFDETYVTYDEDLDVCRRLHDAGRAVALVPDVVLTHIGGRSSTPAEKLRMMRRGRARYYRKHRGALASLAYRVGIGTLQRARLARRHRRATFTPDR
jgi:N-acetylglucosaminyl-diphospho-decaprenol L-rhamnosyltransferase